MNQIRSVFLNSTLRLFSLIFLGLVGLTFTVPEAEAGSSAVAKKCKKAKKKRKKACKKSGSQSCEKAKEKAKESCKKASEEEAAKEAEAKKKAEEALAQARATSTADAAALAKINSLYDQVDDQAADAEEVLDDAEVYLAEVKEDATDACLSAERFEKRKAEILKMLNDDLKRISLEGLMKQINDEVAKVSANFKASAEAQANRAKEKQKEAESNVEKTKVIISQITAVTRNVQGSCANAEGDSSRSLEDFDE